MVLVIVGTIISICENRFRQDLLSDQSLEKFRKMNVSRLELKRYLANTYMGSTMTHQSSVRKRKEIPLESQQKDKMGMFNTVENELTVYAYITNTPHEVFTCPFCEENKNKLLDIVNAYNTSS